MQAAAPKRCPSGVWGVRLDPGSRGEIGEYVVVTARNHKQWVTELGDIEIDEPRGQLWSTNHVDCDVPPNAPTPVDEPKSKAKWHGTPTRLDSDEWGVSISMDQTHGMGHDGGDLSPAKGDVIDVKTQGGKTWQSRLLSGAFYPDRKVWKCAAERIG